MYRIACLFFLFLLSCKPQENNEGVPASPEAGAAVLEETADSVSNARKDGTQISPEVPLDIKQQLPAALEVTLDRTHGLWQFPSLTTADAQRVPKEEQGPYFLEADFNGDRKPDFAVQIVERDTAFVYAFVSTSKTGENWQEYLLEKNALQVQEGKKRSLQFLRLAKKSDKVNTQEKNFTLPNDGISVGSEKSTAIYVFDDGQFRQYNTGG
ncbi:MAG: hypothetical protein ACO1OQ_08550 [Rufibacter sp.]